MGGYLGCVSINGISLYIWKERNMRIFNDRSLNEEEVIKRIKRGICEVVNLKCVLKSSSIFTWWDNEIQKQWGDLKVLQMEANNKQTKRQQSQWVAPLHGKSKLNFDTVRQLWTYWGQFICRHLKFSQPLISFSKPSIY